MGKRIAIVGSRDFPNLDQVREYVRSLPRDTIIVSGGARGVDTAAEYEANVQAMQTMIFPADWERYGKSAGYKRNISIVAYADEVVAFWDGKSRGTMHTVEIAREKGIPVKIYGPTEP